jgi:hypothetical protein
MKGHLPKVLLIEGDDLEGAKLKCLARGRLAVTVEHHPLNAINRVGLEDFDAVVVDPDVSLLPVTEKLLELLGSLRVPVMVIEKETGNSRQLSASARLRNRTLLRSRFVDSVLACLPEQVPA